MTNVTRTPPNVTSIVDGFADPASLGANTLLAAPSATARIRVVGLNLVASGAVNIRFQSDANNISALQSFAANGGIVLPFNEHGWMETLPGQALVINLSAAVAVGVNFQYIILP